MRTKYRVNAVLASALFLMGILSACHSETTEAAEIADTASPVSTAETKEYTAPTIVVGQAEAHPGDVVTVPIHIMQSPGIAACRLIVEFNNDNLELQSYSYGEAFAENGEEPAHLTSPVPFTWSQLENVAGDELFAELTFKVNEDAEVSQTFPVAVRYSTSDLIDLDENEVEFTVENGSVSTVK